jgi:hypothetical protein
MSDDKNDSNPSKDSSRPQPSTEQVKSQGEKTYAQRKAESGAALLLGGMSAKAAKELETRKNYMPDD